MAQFVRTWCLSGGPNEYPQLQLWNSGTLPLEVELIEVSSNVSQGGVCLVNAIPLDHPLTDIPTVGSARGLKLDGSFSHHGEIRFYCGGNQIEGGQLVNHFWLQNVNTQINGIAGSLPPGRGIFVRPGSVGCQLRVTFGWSEPDSAP